VIVFVTRDGQKIDEYEKGDFAEKIYGGEVLSSDHYWIEGMDDWRPVSEYTVAMKTMKIEMDASPAAGTGAGESAPGSGGALKTLRRWLNRGR
jgi:hypothetical protein